MRSGLFTFIVTKGEGGSAGMNDDKILEYLKGMESRILRQIQEAKAEIIEEVETTLMEIGVYKKEILEKMKKTGLTKK